MDKPIFITGTDTDVGKTIMSSILVNRLNAHYWKPIQSGLEDETDTQKVKRLCNLSNDRIIPEQFRLKLPRSPHEAAEKEGIEIDYAQIINKAIPLNTVIEGAGGLMVPITYNYYMIDLIRDLDCSVVLVARTQLGTLNHTLLSIEALNSRGLQIELLVLNGDEDEENFRTLTKLNPNLKVVHVPRLNSLEFNEIDSVSKNILI